MVLACRKHKQRQAIYEADDGDAPPLYDKVTPALLWGSLYGTEHLDPSGLRKWKSTAVSADYEIGFWLRCLVLQKVL